MQANSDKTLSRKLKRLAEVTNCWECPHSMSKTTECNIEYSCTHIGELFKIVKHIRPVSILEVAAREKGIHKDCPLEAI